MRNKPFRTGQGIPGSGLGRPAVNQAGVAPNCYGQNPKALIRNVTIQPEFPDVVTVVDKSLEVYREGGGACLHDCVGWRGS